MKFKKTGFSLVELLIVFAVIIALSVTAFLIYNKVSYKSKSKDISDKIILAASTYDNTASPLLSLPNWDSSMNDDVDNSVDAVMLSFKNAGVIKDTKKLEYMFEPIEEKNDFGGLVKVSISSIVFEDIPLEACNYVVASLSAYLSNTHNGVMTNCFSVIDKKANADHGEEGWNPYEGQNEDLEYTDIELYFSDKTLSITNSNFRPSSM